MGPVVVIIMLIAVFSVIEKLSKAAKTGSNPKSKGQGAPRMAANPMPIKSSAAAQSIRDAVEAFLEEGEEDVPEQMVAARQVPEHEEFIPAEKFGGKVPQGASFADEEGCVGGSLGGHDEEGESRAEHAEHLDRADKALAAETAGNRRAESLRAAGIAQLRQAVVMSEILDKPKALRRR